MNTVRGVVIKAEGTGLFVVGVWIVILLFVTCPIWGLFYLLIKWLRR